MNTTTHQAGKIYILDGNRYKCLKANRPGIANVYQLIDSEGYHITNDHAGGKRIIYARLPEMTEEVAPIQPQTARSSTFHPSTIYSHAEALE